MSYKINSLIVSEKVVVSYEKRMSICLLSNGFSFSISTVHDEILALGEVECKLHTSISELLADIKGVMAEGGIQAYGLKETELVVNSRQFVWVPEHLYDDSKQRVYIEAMCKIESGHGVFSDFNSTVKAHMVFCADNNIVSAFKIAFPGLMVKCQHDKMANRTMMENSDLKSIILINVRDGESDYSVFCNKKLMLSNTFDCANFDETLYHALNLTKQLHLEDAMMMAAVCGDVDRERFARLRQFFPNVALYTGRPLTMTNPEMQHFALYRHALILS